VLPPKGGGESPGGVTPGKGKTCGKINRGYDERSASGEGEKWGGKDAAKGAEKKKTGKTKKRRKDETRLESRGLKRIETRGKVEKSQYQEKRRRLLKKGKGEKRG